MPLIVKGPESSFEPAPEGLHPGVCVDVIDKGNVTTEWGTKHQVELRWVIQPEEGEQAMCSKRYTLSLHEKANLRGHLESWRGKRFTSEELKGFDLELLIGVPCQIQIIHTITGKGDTWANVHAVLPASKSVPPVVPVKPYTRVQDREQDQGYSAEQYMADAEDQPF